MNAKKEARCSLEARRAKTATPPLGARLRSTSSLVIYTADHVSRRERKSALTMLQQSMPDCGKIEERGQL